MPQLRRTGTVVAILALLAIVSPAFAQPAPVPQPTYRVSGPYTYQNLSVYLVHGASRLGGKHMLTLSEAIRRKKIRVHETGEVNELEIENRSSTDTIFIQAGEIVKGGQQDRAIGADLVLAPRSGRTAVPVFCVEQGRWNGRSGESSTTFDASTARVPSRELKLAVRYEKDQSKVWNNVKRTQDKLSANVGASVNSAQSATSLQLALENRRLADTSARYIRELEPVVHGRPDVIGCVFAVNGEMSGAGVYG